MTTKPKIIPAGDYKVRRLAGNSTHTTYTILNGPYEGHYLFVPNHMVPDTILTVSVEHEVTTVERNVVRFKSKARPREGPPADGTPYSPDHQHWLD